MNKTLEEIELVCDWIFHGTLPTLQQEREASKVAAYGPTPHDVRRAKAWKKSRAEETRLNEIILVIAWLQDEHQGPENFRKIAYVRKHGPTLKQVQIAKNWKDFRDNLILD